MRRFILLLLLGCQLPAADPTPTIRVLDGDTIMSKQPDGSTRLYQLHGVDAPELDQPYGPEARDYLQTLVKPPLRIQVRAGFRTKGLNVYVVTIKCGRSELDPAEALISRGLAFPLPATANVFVTPHRNDPYRAEPSGKPLALRTSDPYARAASKSRRNKLRIWRKEWPVTPEQHRMQTFVCEWATGPDGWAVPFGYTMVNGSVQRDHKEQHALNLLESHFNLRSTVLTAASATRLKPAFVERHFTQQKGQ